MATPITTEGLLGKIERGDDFILMEVLPADSYERGHLPRAIDIPLTHEFEDSVRKAAPDTRQPVVVYCSGPECSASSDAARRLEALGYGEVMVLDGGKEAWEAAGLALETST